MLRLAGNAPFVMSSCTVLDNCEDCYLYLTGVITLITIIAIIPMAKNNYYYYGFCHLGCLSFLSAAGSLLAIHRPAFALMESLLKKLRNHMDMLRVSPTSSIFPKRAPSTPQKSSSSLLFP